MALPSIFKSDDWHSERRQGIGGRHAANLLGFGFNDPIDVWRYYTGRITEDIVTEDMVRGIWYEGMAAEVFEFLADKKVRKHPMQFHSEHDFIRSNIDRKVEGEPEAVEIKVPSSWAFDTYRDEGLREGDIVQGQHYLAVHDNYDRIFYLIFNVNSPRESLYFAVERDDEQIRKLVDLEREFWRDHIEADTPPPEGMEPDRGALELEDKSTGVVVEKDTEEYVEAARSYIENKRLKERAESLEDEAKSEIENLMNRDGIDKLLIPGLLRMSRVHVDGRTSWKKTVQKIADQKPLENDVLEYLSDNSALSSDDLDRIHDILVDHEAPEAAIDAVIEDLMGLSVRESLIREIEDKFLFDPFQYKVEGSGYSYLNPTVLQEKNNDE